MKQIKLSIFGILSLLAFSQRPLSATAIGANPLSPAAQTDEAAKKGSGAFFKEDGGNGGAKSQTEPVDATSAGLSSRRIALKRSSSADTLAENNAPRVPPSPAANDPSKKEKEPSDFWPKLGRIVGTVLGGLLVGAAFGTVIALTTGNLLGAGVMALVGAVLGGISGGRIGQKVGSRIANWL